MLVGFFCAVACVLPPGQLQVDGRAVVWRDGRPVGRYVDDEDPTQAQDVEAARDHGLVLAGIPACCATRSFTGAVGLYEHYPVGYTAWPSVPRAQGYILQGTFRWSPSSPAPDGRQRRRMWCDALRHHPRVVLWYSWGPRVGPQVEAIMRQPCPRAR